MKRSDRARGEILYWQSQFRLLKGWTITFDTESEFKGQSSIGVKKKSGVIFDWDEGRMPKDYIFHEMFHMAQAVARETRGSNDKRWAEEIFAQDVSRMVFDGKQGL